MTILPGLGQLNWAAFHRQRAIEFLSAGNRYAAHMEIEKGLGSIWWSRQKREGYLARMESENELARAA